MKKLSFILIAVAAVLNFSCEREQQVETDNTDIWEAEFESDGQDTRTSIDSGNGHVTWNVGDIINFLNGSTEVMRGEVISTENSGRKAVIKTTRLAEGEPVAAFYSGGAGCNPVAIMDGDKMSVSFHIPGVQSGKFEDANISAAAIQEGSRSLTFTNLTSVFEFEVTNPAVRQIKVLWGTSRTEGVDATINFNVPLNQMYSSSISASSQIAGLAINLDSPGKYYMSFPMWTFEANSVTIYYYGEGDVELCKVVYPKIIPYGHKLYLWGDVENRTTAKDPVLPGEFSVGETKKIKFSVGNLVATIDASGAPTAWKFAANQYDCLGEGGANKTIGTAAGDVDLFGWSTDSNTLYGINTSENDNDYSGSFRDWGNKIGDGNIWRTLTTNEWQYLFNSRTASTVNGTANARYAKATVNSKAGVILLPDTYTHPEGVTLLTNINTANATFAGNTYDSANWAKIESAGAVFLPAAGFRDGSNVGNVGDIGYYWSASFDYFVYYVYFESSDVYSDMMGDRNFGYSVRLVTDATITPPSPSLPEELPNGETFNSYMEQLAGELKNIEWIQFSRNVSNPQGGIQIAKDVYMSKVVNTLGKTGIAIKTSNAKFYAHQDCSKMFADCYNAENIYGLQYLDTSSTTDMWAMFSSCEKLTELDLSNFDTSNVTHMGDMFYSCEDLTELDLSSFDTGNVEYMGYMFEWCYALKNIYLGGSFVIPDGCFVDEALLGCKVTMYGTTEEMESFVKALVPGNDYSPGCLHFAIDMGDAGWWSAWNVGAEKPEDYGSYFAWGETEEKTDYSTSNYKWGVYDEDAEPLYGMTKYTGNITGGDGLTTLKFDDDPTCQKWGSNWRTPTLDDFKKLFGRSERTWDDEKKGYIVKCKETGNSIFLPAAGIRGKDGTLGSVGSNGWYWSSSIREDSPCYSYNILFQPTQVVYYNFDRYFGMSVRPIANY